MLFSVLGITSWPRAPAITFLSVRIAWGVITTEERPSFGFIYCALTQFAKKRARRVLHSYTVSLGEWWTRLLCAHDRPLCKIWAGFCLQPPHLSIVLDFLLQSPAALSTNWPVGTCCCQTLSNWLMSDLPPLVPTKTHITTGHQHT